MGDRTGIEWTGSTWNPATGCTKVSAGCDHCYAEAIAKTRLAASYLRHPPVVNSLGARRDPFAVRVWPDRLTQPEKWASPRLIFVNSMSDLFHADIPNAFVREVFSTMLRIDRHVYQILTKRPARVRRFWEKNRDLFGNGLIPAHIWIGTSVEDQVVAHRIDHLRQVPARIRFLSCEPLLGPLKLKLKGIHWVIAGGETGPDYRSMDPSWARSIRDQCARSGVAFFMKQMANRAAIPKDLLVRDYPAAAKSLGAAS